MNNLEELKKKYEELGKEIKRLEKENKRWRAKINEDDYYYIDSFGYIYKETEENEKKDDFRYKTRNYFKTKEQAQAYLDNINTYYDLIDLAEELNGDEKIDWNDRIQEKNVIIYDSCVKNLKQLLIGYTIDIGQIYCLDKKFLEIAKERVGEDRLKKLFEEE